MTRIPLVVLADLPAGLPAQRPPIKSHYVNQVEIGAVVSSGQELEITLRILW